MEHASQIKIPKRRIGALIGENGKTKRRLEDASQCELTVDSEDGTVTIESEESVKIYFMSEVVKAIARGFNPKTAMLLLKQDFMFELIDIRDFASNTNQINRLKGRVIGRDGKSREYIEKLTQTYVSVFGKTVGIIGRAEYIGAARKAVEQLLNGSTHGSVFKVLEQHREAMKREAFRNF